MKNLEGGGSDGRNNKPKKDKVREVRGQKIDNNVKEIGQDVEDYTSASLFMLKYSISHDNHFTQTTSLTSHPEKYIARMARKLFYTPESKEKELARATIREFIKQVYALLEKALPDEEMRNCFFRAVNKSLRQKFRSYADYQPADAIRILLTDNNFTLDSKSKYEGFYTNERTGSFNKAEKERVNSFVFALLDNLKRETADLPDDRHIDEERAEKLVNKIKRQLNGWDENGFHQTGQNLVGNLIDTLSHLSQINKETFDALLDEEMQWVESARRIKKYTGKEIPGDL